MLTLHVTDGATLDAAAHALQAGEAIVVPTDTVYGLAAVPHDPSAVDRIYAAKGRPEQLHLPVMASSIEQVRALGVEFGPEAAALAARWWPGPLTLALGLGVRRPSWLEGRDEVAVRIPASDFLLQLIARTGVLLVTSANRHGSPTPPSSEEAADMLLAPHVTLLVDGGMLDTIPSTLVNLRTGSPVIERLGAIAADDIARVVAAAT
jgi:L-threonylcarbamoyladenylate synthase